MFAYCLNNPLNHSDRAGQSAVAEAIKNGLWVLPLLDGPLPFGEIIAVVGFAMVLAYEQSHASDIVSQISADTLY